MNLGAEREPWLERAACASLHWSWQDLDRTWFADPSSESETNDPGRLGVAQARRICAHARSAWSAYAVAWSWTRRRIR